MLVCAPSQLQFGRKSLELQKKAETPPRLGPALTPSESCSACKNYSLQTGFCDRYQHQVGPDLMCAGFEPINAKIAADISMPKMPTFGTGGKIPLPTPADFLSKSNEKLQGPFKALAAMHSKQVGVAPSQNVQQQQLGPNKRLLSISPIAPTGAANIKTANFLLRLLPVVSPNPGRGVARRFAQQLSPIHGGAPSVAPRAPVTAPVRTPVTPTAPVRTPVTPTAPVTAPVRTPVTPTSPAPASVTPAVPAPTAPQSAALPTAQRAQADRLNAAAAGAQPPLSTPSRTVPQTAPSPGGAPAVPTPGVPTPAAPSTPARPITGADMLEGLGFSPSTPAAPASRGWRHWLGEGANWIDPSTALGRTGEAVARGLGARGDSLLARGTRGAAHWTGRAVGFPMSQPLGLGLARSLLQAPAAAAAGGVGRGWQAARIGTHLLSYPALGLAMHGANQAMHGDLSSALDPRGWGNAAYAPYQDLVERYQGVFGAGPNTERARAGWQGPLRDMWSMGPDQIFSRDLPGGGGLGNRLTTFAENWASRPFSYPGIMPEQLDRIRRSHLAPNMWDQDTSATLQAGLRPGETAARQQEANQSVGDVVGQLGAGGTVDRATLNQVASQSATANVGTQMDARTRELVTSMGGRVPSPSRSLPTEIAGLITQSIKDPAYQHAVSVLQQARDNPAARENPQNAAMIQRAQDIFHWGNQEILQRGSALRQMATSTDPNVRRQFEGALQQSRENVFNMFGAGIEPKQLISAAAQGDPEALRQAVMSGSQSPVVQALRWQQIVDSPTVAEGGNYLVPPFVAQGARRELDRFQGRINSAVSELAVMSAAADRDFVGNPGEVVRDIMSGDLQSHASRMGITRIASQIERATGMNRQQAVSESERIYSGMSSSQRMMSFLGLGLGLIGLVSAAFGAGPLGMLIGLGGLAMGVFGSGGLGNFASGITQGIGGLFGLGTSPEDARATAAENSRRLFSPRSRPGAAGSGVDQQTARVITDNINLLATNPQTASRTLALGMRRALPSSAISNLSLAMQIPGGVADGRVISEARRHGLTLTPEQVNLIRNNWSTIQPLLAGN